MSYKRWVHADRVIKQVEELQAMREMLNGEAARLRISVRGLEKRLKARGWTGRDPFEDFASDPVNAVQGMADPELTALSGQRLALRQVEEDLRLNDALTEDAARNVSLVYDMYQENPNG